MKKPLPHPPFKIWMQAARPKTLTASLGPVFLGLALAYTQKNGDLQWGIALVTLLSCLCLQIGTNLVNDYYDFLSGVDRSRQFGPKRATQAGFLTPRQVKTGFLLSLFLGVFFGLFLIYHGGLPILLIGIFSVVVAYAYTGGPFPLSHFGLGEVLALIFFGPVAVAGTFYLQTHIISPMAILCGLGPGFLAAALMSINNIRDHETDRPAGKKTFAVIFGDKNGRYLCLFLVMGAATIPILFMILQEKHPFLVVASLSFLFFFNLWKNVLHHEIDANFNQFLGKTGQFLFLYSLLFSVGVLL